MIGKVISGYRILRPMESFEQAYVARNIANDRDFVVRFLSPSLVTEQAARKRIEHTARMLSQMSPNESSVFHELVVADGHAFFVLEPADAERLLTELRELGRHLSNASSWDIATEQLADPMNTRTAIDAPGLAGLGNDTSGHTSGFAPGRLLGSRYRLIGKLGMGGMGEVWHAFDLKLQVEVALKSLRRDRFPNEETLELLRNEVRAGREVVSPNVCRIYDLVELDGQELLSMEFVDGRTLQDLLREHGPLDPSEAGRIASQFLFGLEAVHEAGLVHRDVKPENVMITRTGRVVVMDFGIAQESSQNDADPVAGTLPYMAPELLRGSSPNVRTDLYAAAIVLAEMIAPGGVADAASRKKIWDDVRQTPPALAGTAWEGVLQHALDPEPGNRFGTSRELALALEAVTPRVVGADDKEPYPGLEAFTSDDAGYFHGREAEIEALWKRLQRSQLLAVIGASGAGKSSFLKAGVIPASPPDWGWILCQPGTNPHLSLARALAPKFASDSTLIDLLLQFEDDDVALSLVERWRHQHNNVLLMIDQFEEIFTQCSLEKRSRFVRLLQKIALDADVHVLLSMRDDFLIQCQEHPLLAPIFAELTPLGPLTGNALRRALVQPALACGYRFEDEELIEEILDDVRGERGALPLLAFAMAGLWEKRDRKTGRLTRGAYEELGRVNGALAQHAERTLEWIGFDREGIVREIFRNLVTAQGTRAALTIEELTSVFAADGEGQAEKAAEVIRALIDARLLTSYEEEVTIGERKQARRRIEVVHESLFRSWPRLVRWRTQDAAGAQLRDQLRQASQAWKDRRLSDDLLWTGKTFREFLVWRENYPGRLTAVEEGFASAMKRKAERLRRRRRQLVAGSLVSLVGILVVVLYLYRQSTIENRRARANELFRQAQQLPRHNVSQKIAYAIASLELLDAPEVRRFALKALDQGPAAFVIPGSRGFGVEFSNNGAELIASNYDRPVQVWPSSGGAVRLYEDSLLSDGEGYFQFIHDGKQIVGYQHLADRKLRFWSYPEWREVAALGFDELTMVDLSPNRRYMVSRTDTKDESGAVTRLQVWSLVEQEPKWLAARTVDRIPAEGRMPWYPADFTSIDNSGSLVVYASGQKVELLPVRDFASAVPRLVGQHEAEVGQVSFHPDGDRVLSVDNSGEVRVWLLKEDRTELLREIQGQGDIIGGFCFDPTGMWFGAASASGTVELWNLARSERQVPIRLGWGPRMRMSGLAFHPSGQWIATANVNNMVAVWPVGRVFPLVIDHGEPVDDFAISPDGQWIASAGVSGVRLWRMGSGHEEDVRVMSTRGTNKVAWDPSGRFLAVRGLGWSGVGVLSLVDESTVEYGEAPTTTDVWNNISAIAVSPSGRYIAAEWVSLNRTEEARIHVYDRTTGDEQVLLSGQMNGLAPLVYLSDKRLLHDMWADHAFLWDLTEGTHTEQDIPGGYFELSRDRSKLFSKRRQTVIVHDLASGVTQEVASIEGRLSTLAFDPDGRFYVAGMQNGDLVVGPLDGGEPHLLPGHEGSVNRVRVDPKGRWVVSAGVDGTIRIWPIPTGRPLQNLSHADFLKTLRGLTNLRIVEDDESDTGYRLDVGPFPGWDQPPAQ